MKYRKTWFWNADHTWENFSYLIEDQNRVNEADNLFLENKYKRSCLYYSEVSIESLLNNIMRQKLQDDEKSEEKIYEELRYTSFYKKLTDWPGKIFGSRIELLKEEIDLFKLYESFYEMRNNLTHPKHYDHSIYADLKSLKVKEITKAATRVLSEIFLRRDEVFPYWLLGWNFIGFNNNDFYPVILNNSQFLHALSRMGFIDKQTALSVDHSKNWQKKHMSSFSKLLDLQQELDSYPHQKEQTENYDGPVLTRNWWNFNQL